MYVSPNVAEYITFDIRTISLLPPIFIEHSHSHTTFWMSTVQPEMSQKISPRIIQRVLINDKNEFDQVAAKMGEVIDRPIEHCGSVLEPVTSTTSDTVEVTPPTLPEQKSTSVKRRTSSPIPRNFPALETKKSRGSIGQRTGHRLTLSPNAIVLYQPSDAVKHNIVNGDQVRLDIEELNRTIYVHRDESLILENSQNGVDVEEEIERIKKSGEDPLTALAKLPMPKLIIKKLVTQTEAIDVDGDDHLAPVDSDSDDSDDSVIFDLNF